MLRSCCSANVHAPCSHSLTLLPCSSNRWFPCGWFAMAAEQKLVRSMACLKDGKLEASYEGRSTHRVVYQQEDVARDKFTIRIDLMWREICKATACVDAPPIPVAICAAASEHYVSGNINCSIRALRYCSVFWSHDRCVTSTFR